MRMLSGRNTGQTMLCLVARPCQIAVTFIAEMWKAMMLEAHLRRLPGAENLLGMMGVAQPLDMIMTGGMIVVLPAVRRDLTRYVRRKLSSDGVNCVRNDTSYVAATSTSTTKTLRLHVP